MFPVFIKGVLYNQKKKKKQQKLEKLILEGKHFFGPISCSLAPIYHLHFLGFNLLLKQSIRSMFFKLCSTEPQGTTRGFWVSSND